MISDQVPEHTAELGPLAEIWTDIDNKRQGLFKKKKKTHFKFGKNKQNTKKKLFKSSKKFHLFKD